MQRVIFHVDVNSAFLSWEAARRVSMGEGDIRLIPSAIGGHREKRTGVILAKSIPAKKFNIKTGEPVAMAFRKCPHLFLAKPDFLLYEKNSKAFMDICCKYSPIVEKYSIDECFIDMGGTQELYPNIIEVANRIKNDIRDNLGFTVNIGIGANKILAKMASDFQKPDKLHTLFHNEMKDKLWPLPVRELFSVGKATSQRLKKGYINTIGELAMADLRGIQALVGVNHGIQIHEYANGIDDTPVLDEPRDPKGYSNSITLEEDVRTIDTANRILLALVDSVTSRMRADNVKAFCISVTIRGQNFKDKSRQTKLSMPADVTSEIFDIAKRLFSEVWDYKTPLRLLGVSLSDLSNESYEQQSLFHNQEKVREEKLDKTIDYIRKKYGADTITRGSLCQTETKVGKKYRAQLENET